MKKHLVLIGGGHAHMQTIDQLDSFIQKNHTVTVVQPSEYHYYSGMGPGMLGGTYKAEDIRFATKGLVLSRGGRFIQDKAVRIDPLKQLIYLEKSNEEVHYDVLSCNVGSYVPSSSLYSSAMSIYAAKPIEALQQARYSILEKLRTGDITIAIIGGGPSAVEIAGNVHQLCNGAVNSGEILLFAGREFLGGNSPMVRSHTRKILQRKGVEIIEGQRVEGIVAGQVKVEGGDRYSADIVFNAIGSYKIVKCLMYC